jgi:predicted ATPase
VHWIDASSAALLDHLLPLVDGRLLVCAACRPDPGTPAAALRELAEGDYAGRCTELVLAPLSRDEGGRLVRDLLHLNGATGRVEEWIVAKAGGNPLFLEELAGSLVEQGVVARDSASGGLELSQRLDGIAIPDTLRGVIAARIDRLPDGYREALRAASVIGRSFPHRVVQAIVAEDAELDDALASLQELGLIREGSAAREREYTFKHALIQEVTYEGILLERRRELHRRVGEALAAL